MAIATLLPESVSIFAAIVVVCVSFFSSFITAALGLGGGLILLAFMSLTFPPAAVIPVHGVAQLGSNASRFGFLRAHVVWPVIGWFTLGGVIGAALGVALYVELPPWLLRSGVALFILTMVWATLPKSYNPGKTTYVSVGAFGGFLTMFVGATGPLAAGMLAATQFNRMQIVGTHAAAMVAQHGLKSLAFGIVGFGFGAWAFLVAAIVCAGFLGAWAGSHTLNKIPEAIFQRLFKIILTVIASYLLIISIHDALAI